GAYVGMQEACSGAGALLDLDLVPMEDSSLAPRAKEMTMSPPVSIFASTAAVAVLAVATAVPAMANPLECRELAQRYTVLKQSAVDRQVNVFLVQAAQKGCA